MAAFYWENFIYFGQGPRKGADGNLVLALPLGGGKLPGIAVEDIGRCAYGIFKRGPDAIGQRFRFPDADDMGNMYEHHAILGEEFRRHRSPEVARAESGAPVVRPVAERECIAHPAGLRHRV